MDLESLRTFFMWCTILNGGIFLLAWLFTTFAQGWVYRMHSRLYPLTREQFNVVIYASIGLLKIIVFAFSLVPYLALLIMS